MIRLRPLTEVEFTRQVIRFAGLHRWKCAHFRPARTEKGWRTPVQGDGKGFPDLVLLRGGRQVVAELKVGRGKPTREQDEWIALFTTARVETYIWRPEDWPLIETVLGAP